MSGVGQLVTSGPLILALPVAAAAGAVTFLSPCCLPLVPGYLSFVTGMAGAGGSPAAPAAPGDAPGSVPPDGSGVAVAAPPLATTATAPPRGDASSPGRRCSCWASPSSSWRTARPSAGSAIC